MRRRLFLVAVGSGLLGLLCSPFLPCSADGPPAPPQLGLPGGIYPTVLTPWTESGVDVESLEKQLHYELDAGVHGLLVLGTLGEGHLASDEERGQVIATAVRVAAGRVPVVVGIHTSDLTRAKAQMLQAKALGAQAVLVKYCGHPNPCCGGAVLEFFRALTACELLPIIYYHYPEDTGAYLTAEEIAAILRLPGVIGIKETTLHLREVAAHVCLTRGLGKVFFTGMGFNLRQFMQFGGHGAMCVEGVLLPRTTIHTYEAIREGRDADAQRLQRNLFEVLPLICKTATVPLPRALITAAQNHMIGVPLSEGTPQARVKAALDCLGVPTPSRAKYTSPLTLRDWHRVERAVPRLQAVEDGEIR